MFIDHVIVDVAAGDGGDGCVAFRREKFVPRGGPSGGDGGRGGDVVVIASDDVSTLVDLHYKRLYRAERGEHGKGKSQKGRDGKPVEIVVPVGTVVKDVDTGEIVCEMLSPGDRAVVAVGGSPGKGNERYKSSRNRAPRQFTYGGDGETRKLEITLKLVADVGLVGAPNAGKSTLLSVVSAAHPKIADYPFTTKTPVLGIVKSGDFESFVMVDIPGLIEGAHEGRGMGREFLRHVERCRVLVFLVDVTGDDPEGSYHVLRNEILRYDPALLEKPSVLALTKCDALSHGLDRVAAGVRNMHERTVPISAIQGQGLSELIRCINELLEV